MIIHHHMNLSFNTIKMQLKLLFPLINMQTSIGSSGIFSSMWVASTPFVYLTENIHKQQEAELLKQVSDMLLPLCFHYFLLSCFMVEGPVVGS